MPHDEFEQELLEQIPSMRAFARSLCGGDMALADDLSQDALTRALKSRASYQPGTNMKAWLFMILRNQFYSDKRRSWRASQLDPEVAERTLVASDSQDAIVSLDEVRRALNLLSEDQREAIILIGAGGLSYEEAAVIADVPVGTIKSRVSRARVALQQILEKGHLAHDERRPSEAMDALLARVPDQAGD